MKKLKLLLLLQFMVVFAFGQINLSGVVKGNGEALAGASVVIKNTLYGVSTSADGSFVFTNLKAGEYTLKISFIGFETREEKVYLSTAKTININLTPNMVLTDEILISATRAKSKTPMAYNNLSGEEIAKQNMGQDIPYLLQLTPSFVATSDAGAGVGYTNFRIRGTDLNRINVSVNGIPLNDSESHGTWFVNIPDMASSLENVQVQRGVGTSTNGPAAFGATINLQTNTLKKNAYSEYKTALGSFNTKKNTISAGTGLLNGKFSVDARLSKISSDGYIDRASSDLKSFFVSAGYYSENTILKANVFSGFEKTYHAWNGIDEETLKTNRTYNSAGEYTDAEGQTQYYDNQIDHYQQDHYQLHFTHKFSESVNFNASLHHTYGRGYYESYKQEEDLLDYNINPIEIGGEVIEVSDLINRKWLDNRFTGITYALNYTENKSDLSIGGGYSNYDGDHFGHVIWGQNLGQIQPNYEYYRSKGLKKDFNIYAKYNYQLVDKLSLFADLQYRAINYEIDGVDDDQRNISQTHKFNFFNPKLGIFYQAANNQEVYLSMAVANREPNRSNYVDADLSGKQPVHETLTDWEAGYNYKSRVFSASANLYYMSYKDQLVLTGEINDVGAPVMVNVDKSYRSGIELQAGLQLVKQLRWNGNITLSTNKIKNFTEYVDNWDTWGQETFELGTTDLAFSPGIVATNQYTYSPNENLNFGIISNYVGKQFMDNTSSDNKALKAYFVHNFKADYTFTTNLFEEITIHFMANNVLNKMYESNAWVYSYIYGGERYKMVGYYPQAGTHFMIGLDFRF